MGSSYKQYVEDIEGIWNSADYQALRKSVNKGVPPKELRQLESRIGDYY